MNKPALQWVKVNGIPVHVSKFADLPSAKRPDMFCPICGSRVAAKLGNIRVHHAAHIENLGCIANQPETVIHINGKYHIKNELGKYNQLVIAQSCAGWEAEYKDYQIGGWCEKSRNVIIAMDWTNIQLEYGIGNYRADIALLQNSQVVLGIEVHVTHQVDDEKRKFLKEKGIPWIEVPVDESFYSGELAWSIDKPIPIEHGFLPMVKQWVCSDCLEDAEKAVYRLQKRYERDHQKAGKKKKKKENYEQLLQFVDYYYASGKTYRQLFIAHINWNQERSSFWGNVAEGNYQYTPPKNLGKFSAGSRKEALKKASNILKDYHIENRYIKRIIDSPMKWQPLPKDVRLYTERSEGILPKRYVLVDKKWQKDPEINFDVRWDSFWTNPNVSFFLEKPMDDTL